MNLAQSLSDRHHLDQQVISAYHPTQIPVNPYLNQSPSIESQLAAMTHVANTTKQQLKHTIEESMRDMYQPEVHLIISSIMELPFANETHPIDPGLTMVKVVNLTDDTNKILFEGEELKPIRVFPSSGGIECHGQWCCQFLYANHETQLAVKKYNEELAHTKKLLNDLPIALANNEIAFSSYVESIHTEREISYEEVGTMALEHYRIQKEIDQQTSRLKELESKPVRANPSDFICYQCRTSVLFKFGRNSLDHQLYDVIRLPESAPIHPARVETPSRLQPFNVQSLSPLENAHSSRA